MGFGWVLLGYLSTFILFQTAERLGLGFIALLFGCALMLAGVLKLEKFERRFAPAKGLLLLLIFIGVYNGIGALLTLLSVTSPVFASGLAKTIVEWLTFASLIALQAALLAGVLAISREVGLLHLASKSIRNLLFVFLYAVLYLLLKLPLGGMERVRPYLVPPTVIAQVLMIGLNLFLFLSCMKNIAPAGEEEQEPKRYRWEFLNRVGDMFEENRQKAADSTRAYAEEQLRARREKREKKRIDHGKK